MKNKLLKAIIMLSKCFLYGLVLQTLMLNLVLALNASGQYRTIEEVRVTLSTDQLSVDQFFSEVQRQTPFKFSFEHKDVNRQQSLTFEKKEGLVIDFLKEAAQQTKLSFRQVNHGIDVLKRKGSGAVLVSTAEITISGRVVDENGESLPGATVSVAGTTTGTVTDLDGNYSLSVPENSVIVFSFIGYETQRISLGNRSEINVVMAPDMSSLEEVLVIGYGTVRQKDLTGAVSRVKSEDLEMIPVFNVEQALQGRAPGVQVRQNSGAPGGRIEVRIRGGNSMIGDNGPLYVVDGFPITGNIDFLNPEDIASVDILKDASATAIYGSRGANGVVIITSKKGNIGQPSRIEIHSRFGFQQEVNRYNMLDATQYATVANEWLTNSGQPPFYNLNEVQSPGTNWQDFIFRDAPMNVHTLTFSGGNDKTTFALSGNYFDQQGLIRNSGAQKGSIRLNLNHYVNKKFSVAFNINLNRNEVNNIPADGSALGGSMLAGAMAAPPTQPVFDENGDVVRINQVYPWGDTGMRNPAEFLSPFKNRLLTNTVLTSTSFNYDITEELSFKSIFGLEYNNRFSDVFNPIIFPGDRGFASNSNSNQNSFLNENLLTYSKKFNDIHDIDLVGGFTYQTNTFRSFGIGVNGFSNNNTQDFNLGAAETVGNPSSNFSEWRLASWLGRVNYGFKEKYLLTASVRTDGSSRFGNNHKWAVFPSGAFAWRISDESFMQNLTFINDMKIRTSYGITGNTGLNAYQSLNRLSPVRGIIDGNFEEVGFVPAAISNPDLRWEKTAQLDVGFDLTMFQNRVRFGFDYYVKNTSDLLASVPLPSSSGFRTSLQNVGEIQNKGIELGLGVDILTDTPLKWDIYTQVSANRNEVIELAGGSDIIGGQGVNIFRYMSIAREGYPLGSFFGLIEDGLDEQGFIKYTDLNGDGQITVQDEVIIGNPHPDFIYSFNTNLSYKGFDLNLFFEGVQGVDIWWATAASHLNSFQRGVNQFADLMGNYWTPENPDPNAKYPRISPLSQVTNSDRFVHDGSYFRLKSLRLAYNIPSQKLGIKWMNQAQVYLSGTNLFTVTNYPGIDPDVNTTGSDSQNINDRLAIGVDESAYPLNRVYTLGVKIGF